MIFVVFNVEYRNEKAENDVLNLLIRYSSCSLVSFSGLGSNKI